MSALPAVLRRRLVARDTVAGLLFTVIGVTWAIVAASGYRLGAGGRVGPGFFPLVVGIGLAGCGALLTLRAVLRGGERLMIDRRVVMPIIVIGVAVAGFALALPVLGFVLSGTLLVIVARALERPYRPIGTVLLGVGLAGVCAALFVGALDLAIPLWPAW